jgi:hypothetical protein
MWLTQALIQCLLVALFVGGVKQLGCEGDYSLPTSAEVKNRASIHLLAHTSSWHDAYLVKHRDNLTFTFI